MSRISKTASPKAGRGEKRADYFFALQVAQVAQVALASVQHFIPQPGFSAEHLGLPQQAQPVMRTAAHRSAPKVAMSFM